MACTVMGIRAGKKGDFTGKNGGFCLQKKFLFFHRKKKLPSEILLIACTAI
jgi:hypothetical protein